MGVINSTHINLLYDSADEKVYTPNKWEGLEIQASN